MMGRPKGNTTISAALYVDKHATSVDAFLGAVLAQKQAPDELIVADASSSPDVRGALEHFRADAPFPVTVDVIDDASDAAWTRMVERCSGEVIVLAEPQEIWGARKILRTSKAFDGETNVGIAFNDAQLISTDGRSLGFVWDAMLFDAELRRLAMLLGGGNVPAHHAVIRRQSAARLLPAFVYLYLSNGALPAFRAELRDIVLPVAADVPATPFISLVASIVRPFRLITEPLVSRPPPDVPWLFLGDRSARTFTEVWRLRAILSWRNFRKSFVTELRSHWATEAMLYEAVADRLQAAGREDYLVSRNLTLSMPAAAAAVDLRSQAQYFARRASIPTARLRRWGTVRTNLRSYSYDRYSGIKGVLQDIFV